MTRTEQVETPARHGTPHPANGAIASPKRLRIPGLFNDRQVLLGLAVLMPVVLAVGTWSFVSELDEWRTDTMQAVDRGGLYLFILSPCYAGICAWSAVSTYRSLGPTVEGLPDDSLVWRRAWLPFAVAATLFHALYLIALVGVALASDASGGIDALPLLVQLLSIPFFCALGAAVGGRWRSVVTAPVLFLALLAGNTLLVRYGFRRISEVGTGSADFIDMQLSLGYLLPKAVLFAAGIVWAVPLQARGRVAVAVRRVLPATVAVAMVVWVFATDGDAQVYRPGTPVCHTTEARLRLCAPPDIAGQAAGYDAPVDRVARIVRATGATAVPRQVALVSRGATALPARTVVLTVTSVSVRQSTGRLRDAAFGYAYAQSCDDPRSVMGPPDGVLETRGLLDGWLQHRLGLDEPGTYPRENLAALEALPTALQQVHVARMLDAVWRCDPTVQPFRPETPVKQ